MDSDSQNTIIRTQIKKLYSQLKIVPSTTSFGCAHLLSCQRSGKDDRRFHTGNWAYVGVDYGKAKIQGKQVKILFIAMDRGGYGGQVKEEFKDTQREFRSSTEERKNPHMGGVSLIMKELVDDKEPNVYSHQFALTNAVKCSKDTKSMQTRTSSTMIQNCANHLDKERKVLSPDLIITQGSHPYKTIKRLLKLGDPTDTFKHPSGRGACEIFKHESLIVLTTFHPARLKDMKWSQVTMPKYMESAIRKTQEIVIQNP
ncbi:hypothetical protein HQ587_04850 [bacterium]|nr:hypothetical protein [bacterium]